MGNAQGQLTPQEQKDLVQAANFSERDIKKLYKRFRALDTNQNGELDPHELFEVPEIADNPLVKRVLSIFDTNGDGRVSFIEFLVGLSKLAAGTDEMQKTKFAFDVYDINKDGHISNGELFAVMKMMVGNNLNDQQLQQLVDRTIVQADKDGDGMISFEEFREVWTTESKVQWKIHWVRKNLSKSSLCEVRFRWFPTSTSQINSELTFELLLELLHRMLIMTTPTAFRRGGGVSEASAVAQLRIFVLAICYS